MKNILSLAFLLLSVLTASAQQIYIPETIYFAGMRLELNNQVRQTLETEVSNLRRNQKYFQMKVDRADLYFPIIEKVFKEENFPDDFKYLALQESSLVSDAVSSSNAVGYWQFKKPSAEEVGLRCDNVVDERMNIVSATRGATRYLKRNNATLKNWVYALLSYNLGLGGVQKEVDEKYLGASTMKINNRMHWYVIRFLAHKLAFEGAVGKVNNNTLRLLEYSCKEKSLKDIARETDLSLEELENYNKWARRGKVPEDKNYVVILPVHKENVYAYADITDTKIEDNKPEYVAKTRKGKAQSKKSDVSDEETSSKVHTLAFIVDHNRLDAIKAREGDTFEKLADAGGTKLWRILLYNEAEKHEVPEPGKYYYIQAKRNRALVAEHIVKQGESLRDIAQKYGVRSNAIRKKNRMARKEEPEVGRILHLRKKRKRKEPIRFADQSKEKAPEKKTEKPEVKKSERKETEVKADKPKVKEPERKAEKSEVKESERKKSEVKAPENKTAKQEVKESERNVGKPDVKEPERKKPEIKELEVKEPEAKEPEVKVENPASFVYHFVEPGETLYSLSKKYNVEVDSLNNWNNFSESGLKAGSSIIVGRKENPVKPGTSNMFITHTVEQGETLYRISKKYNKSVEDILKWNNKTNSSVSVGEKLKIMTE